MKPALYLAALVLAAPAVALAAWVCTVDHVIATRNVFTLLYQFVLLVGRGLPALVVAVAVLVAAACFPTGRFAGAIVVLTLDVLALAIVAMSTAAPRRLGEVAFFVPALVSLALAAQLVLEHVRGGAAP